MRFLNLNSITWTRSQLPPINEDLLIYFGAYCFQSLKLQLSTIKLYLCGIRFKYIQSAGFNPLNTREGNSLPRLNMILQSIKRLQVQSHRVRLPITFDILLKICFSVKLSAYSSFFRSMMHTIYCVAFYGFLRCGEFTVLQASEFDPNSNLCVGDITFNYVNQCAYLILKASKTDPGRKGVSIALFKNHFAECPFSALQLHLRMRKSQNAIPTDPLFISDNGEPLTRAVFIDALKSSLTLAHIDSSLYSGHSFRSGAATSAAAARIEDHLIKTLGRWSSDSYLRYIKTPLQCLKDAQTSMSLLM